jgi:hypothetical protein
MSNKRKLQVAPTPPTNIAAQITITAFDDGRGPNIQCTTDPANALVLLSYAIQVAVKNLQPPVKAQADPVDKPRNFLGPREG